MALSRQAVELLTAQRSALFAEGIRSEFPPRAVSDDRLAHSSTGSPG